MMVVFQSENKVSNLKNLFTIPNKILFDTSNKKLIIMVYKQLYK